LQKFEENTDIRVLQRDIRTQKAARFMEIVRLFVGDIPSQRGA
jgi:hypothetical protein